jgi:hypothetical protein
MDYLSQYFGWPCQGLVLASQPVANVCDICGLEFAAPAALGSRRRKYREPKPRVKRVSIICLQPCLGNPGTQLR